LPEDAADLALGQAIAFDQLAVGGPLLLELPESRGVHHGAAGLELMDMNVDQGRTLPPKRLEPQGNRPEVSTQFPSNSFAQDEGRKTTAARRNGVAYCVLTLSRIAKFDLGGRPRTVRR
jgi:hypothetical protein